MQTIFFFSNNDDDDVNIDVDNNNPTFWRKRMPSILRLALRNHMQSLNSYMLYLDIYGWKYTFYWEVRVQGWVLGGTRYSCFPKLEFLSHSDPHDRKKYHIINLSKAIWIGTTVPTSGHSSEVPKFAFLRSPIDLFHSFCNRSQSILQNPLEV